MTLAALGGAFLLGFVTALAELVRLVLFGELVDLPPLGVRMAGVAALQQLLVLGVGEIHVPNLCRQGLHTIGCQGGSGAIEGEGKQGKDFFHG